MNNNSEHKYQNKAVYSTSHSKSPLRLIGYSIFFGVLTQAAIADPITFSGQSMETNGDAQLISSDLVLTLDGTTNQAGSAFTDSFIGFSENTSFSTEFSFQVSGSSLGADGLSLTLQNDTDGANALGGNGAGVGLIGISPSFSVVFDTWDNFGIGAGSSEIQIVANGDNANPIVRIASPFDINGGDELFTKIDFDASTRRLDVFLSDSSTLPVTPTVSTFVSDQDLLDLGGQAFTGFTASTGGASNEHKIVQWSGLTALETPPVFDGIEVDLNGTAHIDSGSIVLTQDNIVSQAGSAFTALPISITQNTSFSTDFSFLASGNTNGADGLSFTLQNDVTGSDALGGTGSGVGVLGITPSLSVIFDTWDNFGVGAGSSEVHLVLNGDMANPLERVNSPFDINGGFNLFSWIDYNSTADLLEVFLNDNNVQPLNPLFSTNIDIFQLFNGFGSEAFFGFTASTGGAFNRHEVLSWNLETSTSAAVPEPRVDFLLGMGLLLLVLFRSLPGGRHTTTVQS